MGPLVAFLGSLLTQALTLTPIIIGFALLIAGAVLALGNHQRGKEALMCAFIGGAVMLTSQTMGTSLHP